NIYGLVSSEVDAHMMKNMEWGAVAYLSQSTYGINDNVRYNNSTTYITGCAASSEPTTGYSTPGYIGCENAYNTTIGYLSSTTGNITGIYDMSGGAWEYVMAVIEDSTNTDTPLSGRNSTNNSGFNGLYGDGSGSLTTGTDYPDNKYYDLYDYNGSATTYERGKLGDATKELGNFGNSNLEATSRVAISAWYYDYAYLPTVNYSFAVRGGYYSSGISSGIFCFRDSSGVNAVNHSFRQVLIIQ
ncbi:MAG: hypothetical protein PHE54_05630, partial [Bacilli bacterium]|nr:hypothetical protein [Bacilli bacterium]